MKNTIYRLSLRFLGLLALLMCVMQAFAPDTFANIMGDGALTLAVGAAAGEIDTGSTARERVKPDVSSEITIVRPDMFRLDTALRKIKTKPAKDTEIKWEEVGQRPRIATADAAADIASAAEVVIPLANVGENTYYIINDIARVIDPATNTDHTGFSAVRLLVTGVNAVDNEITVKAFDSTGFVNVPAIDALTHGSELNVVRIGHSKSEKEGAGSPVSMSPVTRSNTVHTFEKFVSISKMRKKLSTYTKDDQVRNIEQAIYDLRLDMEGTFWDGVGTNTTKDGDKMYTMKGFTSFVTTNVIALPAVGALTEDWLLDIGEQVSASVHGSEEKMFYVSPSLWTELSKLNLVSGTLQNRRKERVLGSFATRIDTGHVELLIANHKGFPELGKQRFGAIVDMANVKKRVLEPMHFTTIVPEKSGGSRVKGRKYLETCTIEVRNEETHALLV